MKGIEEIKARWKRRMPRFFKRVYRICLLISGASLAGHEAITAAGIQPHEWWFDIAPYLIGFPAGIAFACKFTVKDKRGLMDDDEEKNANTILDHDNF